MKNILIIQASFYEKISELLLSGATKKIVELGYEYEVITVPGALEIPTVIAFAKESKKYAGYVALGCVIRGETSHYDIVAGESARGLNDIAIKARKSFRDPIVSMTQSESRELFMSVEITPRATIMIS